MKSSTINLFHIPFEEQFETIRNEFPAYEYDFFRHVISLKKETEEEQAYLRLPLFLKIGKELNIESMESNCVYLSIEAGNAALILNKGKETLFHTTFSAYMTRKKQGFSQIKYLKKKGKSRAGSRIRLAESQEFFEKINQKLIDLFELHQIDRIGLNCSKTLLPFLYQSNVLPPFEKKDERLYKIPLHIPQSNYTNLNAAIKKLIAPVIFCIPEKEMELKEIFHLDQ